MSRFTYTSQEILEKIANHCPSAMSSYLFCLNHINKKNFVFFRRVELENDYSLSFTKFKNHMKQLTRENLLEWHLIDDGIAITLADLDV